MLFPREDLFRVDRLAALQSGCLECLPRGIIGAIPPRQFRLYCACHRLAEHTAEIEWPYSVRYDFGGNAVQAKALPERGFQTIRRQYARAPGIPKVSEV